MKSSDYYVFDETHNPTEMISAHFGVWEFKCKDNSRVIVLSKALVELLEKVRVHFKRPVVINSGYRTVQYNSQLPNSSPKSQHTLGKAADIRVTGVPPAIVYDYLNQLYPNSHGIGIYNTFVHVDVREKKSRWDYRTTNK